MRRRDSLGISGLGDDRRSAVDTRQGQPPVARPQIDREHQWPFGVEPKHRRRTTAPLSRSRLLVEQPGPTQPGGQLGGVAAADAQALRGGGPGDPRLGSHDREERSGAQPTQLCRLSRVVGHRRKYLICIYSSNEYILDRVTLTADRAAAHGLRSRLPGLLSLAMASCLAVTTEMLPVGLLPDIGATFSMPESVTGLLVTLYAMMVAALAVPLTVATTRFDRRPLLLATLLGYVVSNVLVAAAPTFAVVAAGRAVGGLTHALFFSLTIGYVPRLVARADVGRALAIVVRRRIGGIRSRNAPFDRGRDRCGVAGVLRGPGGAVVPDGGRGVQIAAPGGSRTAHQSQRREAAVEHSSPSRHPIC